jgi:hypothetical protein
VCTVVALTSPKRPLVLGLLSLFLGLFLGPVYHEAPIGVFVVPAASVLSSLGRPGIGSGVDPAFQPGFGRAETSVTGVVCFAGCHGDPAGASTFSPFAHIGAAAPPFFIAHGTHDSPAPLACRAFRGPAPSRVRQPGSIRRVARRTALLRPLQLPALQCRRGRSAGVRVPGARAARAVTPSTDKGHGCNVPPPERV